MSKEEIENKFSIDMDAYLNGIERLDTQNDEEYKEILALGKTLADRDFSRNSNREAVYSKTLKNITENKGDNDMKKLNKAKKAFITAASVLIICGGFSQTSFAKDFAEKIINRFSSDHITALQVKTPSGEERPVPENLKGKLFDKDGRAVTVLSKNSGKLYDANGEEILGFADGNIVTASQMKERVLVVKDANSLSKYTCFNVDMPSYLPKGYKFDRAELYKDKDGNISNKYINLYFINDKTGKYIYMQQRFADDSTKYELATDGKVEKVKINGVDAALSDGRSINWETKGVSYSLSGKGEISKNDLIKIAESIK